MIRSLDPPASSIMGSSHEPIMGYQGFPGTTMNEGPDFDGSIQERAALPLNSERGVILQPTQDIVGYTWACRLMNFPLILTCHRINWIVLYQIRLARPKVST